MTLYHWDLPQALQERGGWPHARQRLHSCASPTTVARRLGDRVRGWITHQRAVIAAIFGHYTGEHAPGTKDILAALQAAHHMLLAHGAGDAGAAVAAVGGAAIGIALNLAAGASRQLLPGDRTAAVVGRWLPQSLVSRTAVPRPPIPRVARVAGTAGTADGCRTDLAKIAVPTDFLGVNYYSRVVAASIRPARWSRGVGGASRARLDRCGKSTRPGSQELLLRLHRDYRPKAILITENGMPHADVADSAGRVERRARASATSNATSPACRRRWAAACR